MGKQKQETKEEGRERTNIYVIDEALWNWAKYRADELGMKTTSHYLFELIRRDKEQGMSDNGRRPRDGPEERKGFPWKLPSETQRVGIP